MVYAHMVYGGLTPQREREQHHKRVQLELLVHPDPQRLQDRTARHRDKVSGQRHNTVRMEQWKYKAKAVPFAKGSCLCRERQWSG